jgi:hypothetical protein
LEDKAGCLWLGGNRGIVRVSKHELDELAAGKIQAVYPRFFGRAEAAQEECSALRPGAGLRGFVRPVWFPAQGVW